MSARDESAAILVVLSETALMCQIWFELSEVLQRIPKVSKASQQSGKASFKGPMSA